MAKKQEARPIGFAVGQTEQSGTNETTHSILSATTECNECEARHMGLVKEIWEQNYDYEMDIYSFQFEMYNGDEIIVNFKKSIIDEMVLYMKKEQSNKRYVDFIMKK